VKSYIFRLPNLLLNDKLILKVLKQNSNCKRFDCPTAMYKTLNVLHCFKLKTSNIFNAKDNITTKTNAKKNILTIMN
jgi:hypothetical protein